jgi:hypothetical protein
MYKKVVFRRFGYLLDPLFLACVLLYVVNRFWVKPNCTFFFFHACLNDLICIPFVVPPMVWVLRRLRFRFHDDPPTFPEIAIPLLMIAWTFNIWLPNTEQYRNVVFASPWDIVCNALGTIIAGAFWFYWYKAKEK